jgi:hypothetical protein
MDAVLVENAYSSLFPDIPLNRSIVVRYSSSFKGYNANVRYSSLHIEFHLSRHWKDISDDIKIGLIQTLLVKIFSKRKISYSRTVNMDMYDIFMKKIHISIPKSKQDPVLLLSFRRVNEKYFSGIVEECNLVWGQKSHTKFGSYDFSNDTIKMSSIFLNLLPDKEYLLDYVMYHEILHKKLKYESNTLRKRRYHTSEFRELEAKFENSSLCENELKMIASRRGIFANLGRVGISKSSDEIDKLGNSNIFGRSRDISSRENNREKTKNGLLDFFRF